MKTILVTGDPICDHNYYKGKRHTADSDEKRGFRFHRAGGGALLLKDLIAATMKGEKEWITEFGLDPTFESLPLKYHSYCIWEPQAGGGDKAKTEYWRAIEPPLGYGHSAEEQPGGGCPKPRLDAYSPRPIPLAQAPDIVVIDDAGIGFRDAARRMLWSFAGAGSEGKRADWIVLKLTGPIGKNALWDEIASQCQKNLVVIVPAEELRRRDVRLSRGLSWEATAEDLAAELRGNPQLASLLEARHLIVTFQSDGAFWFDNDPAGGKSMLVFDASRAEGEWAESQGKGGAFGYLACLTAAVVRELCLPSDKSEPDKIKPDLEAALGAGLGASRELRQVGHGEVIVDKTEPVPGFPFERIVARIRQPGEKFVSALIPQGERKRGNWMMLDEWQVQARREDKPRPHYEAALAVAVLGPEALERFPVARFGNCQTVDRKEIESLRTIRQLIVNYKSIERQKKPLSIGIFGPPGSGKSFIVTEIAKTVGMKEEDVKVFNLSQFSEVSELIGAFHQVRDLVLKGTTPMILWDEFDAREYKWLQYLLAPMEDGEFQDGQVTHPIGKCIFFFAGATSATYEKFGPCNPNLLPKDELDQLKTNEPDQLRELENAWKDFVLTKGPDFRSRLMGYLNLLGMNRRQLCVEERGRRRWVEDESDLCYPIRRAFFIRAKFKCGEGDRLNLDQSVLRALLEIPLYKSAGRSVEVLCTHIRENSSGRLNRSGLPGHDLLDMHVDARKFWALCEQDMSFVPKAKELAALLHEAYRLQIKDRPEKRHLDVPFAALKEDMQLANIGQALRIPGILRLASMHLEPGTVVALKDLRVARHVTEDPIRKELATTENLELLSEAEHNGWMVERMLNKWRYGRTRDDDKKRHDCLIPYSQLTEYTKNFDRWTIIGGPAPVGKPHEEQFGYVDIVKTVGLRVVMDEEKPATSGKA